MTAMDLIEQDAELKEWFSPDDHNGWLAQTPTMPDKVIDVLEKMLSITFRWSEAKLQETGHERFRMARIETSPLTPNMQLVLLHELQMRRALDSIDKAETFNL